MYISSNYQSSSLMGTNPNDSGQNAALANSGRSASVNGNTVFLTEEAKQLSESESIYTLSTAKGDKEYDLDSYFQAKPAHEGDVFDIEGLLLPNQQNVSALQDHLSKVFPDFLSRHNIPEAPESINYDSKGQIVLPADYPYADQLKQALKEEPAIAKELSTVNALASHLAAFKELEPYRQEMDKANSQAEIDAIIEKYSYLLGDNRQYPSVELSFTEEGKLTVTSEGSALV